MASFRPQLRAARPLHRWNPQVRPRAPEEGGSAPLARPRGRLGATPSPRPAGGSPERAGTEAPPGKAPVAPRAARVERLLGRRARPPRGGAAPARARLCKRPSPPAQHHREQRGGEPTEPSAAGWPPLSWAWRAPCAAPAEAGPAGRSQGGAPTANKRRGRAPSGGPPRVAAGPAAASRPPLCRLHGCVGGRSASLGVDLLRWGSICFVRPVDLLKWIFTCAPACATRKPAYRVTRYIPYGLMCGPSNTWHPEQNCGASRDRSSCPPPSPRGGYAAARAHARPTEKSLTPRTRARKLAARPRPRTPRAPRCVHAPRFCCYGGRPRGGAGRAGHGPAPCRPAPPAAL